MVNKICIDLRSICRSIFPISTKRMIAKALKRFETKAFHIVTLLLPECENCQAKIVLFAHDNEVVSSASKKQNKTDNGMAKSRLVETKCNTVIIG